MANPDAAFGFRVSRHVAGGCPVRVSEYPLSTAYDTDLFSGDIVKSGAAGNVVKATAGDAIRGIFLGVKWIASNGDVRFDRFWAADTVEQSGTIIRAMVVDDPFVQMHVQSSTTVVAADLGLFVDLEDGAGDVNTGQSRQEISTFASTEAQFRMNRIVLDRPVRDSNGNQALSADGLNAIIEISCALHELGIGTLAEV
jgi:hypothetical protein